MVCGVGGRGVWAWRAGDVVEGPRGKGAKGQKAQKGQRVNGKG